MPVLYYSEKQRLQLIQHHLLMSDEEFAKEVLGYSDPKNYTNYLEGKADLSMNAIRSLASYNRNINVGAIFSKENRDYVFIQSNSEFELTRKTDEKIATLNKEIEYLKQTVKDKERIISMLGKNQK